MASYKDIKAGCGSRRRYADGGRVVSERKGPKTVINIVTPQAAAPVAPPAPPVGNSPSPQAGPVPPEAAAMALNQMQGKPAFRDGGTVPTNSGRGKGLRNSEGGASGGLGRLGKSREAKAEKHVGYARGGEVLPKQQKAAARAPGTTQTRKDGGVLKAKTRNKLPKSDFGLPGERKYPMPDRAHAANAKARASQMEKAGKLSPAGKAKIDAKANRKLGE